MLHKAENLYFNVTIENQETKSNRPEKYYNLLCLWGVLAVVCTAMQNPTPKHYPRGCAKKH